MDDNTRSLLHCVVLEHVAHSRHCVMRSINVLLTYLHTYIAIRSRFRSTS